METVKNLENIRKLMYHYKTLEKEMVNFLVRKFRVKNNFAENLLKSCHKDWKQNEFLFDEMLNRPYKKPVRFPDHSYTRR